MSAQNSSDVFMEVPKYETFRHLASFPSEEENRVLSDKLCLTGFDESPCLTKRYFQISSYS